METSEKPAQVKEPKNMKEYLVIGQDVIICEDGRVRNSVAELTWTDDPQKAYSHFSDSATVMKERLAAMGIETELEELIPEGGKWILRRLS